MKAMGLLDKWLINIKNTYQDNRSVIDSITDPEARVNLLAEIQCSPAGDQPVKDRYHPPGLGQRLPPTYPWLGVWFERWLAEARI